MSRGGRGARFLKKMGRGGGADFPPNWTKNRGGVIFNHHHQCRNIFWKNTCKYKRKISDFWIRWSKIPHPPPHRFFSCCPAPSFLTLIVYGKFANFPWYIHFYVYSAPGQYFLRGGWEYFRRGAAKMGGSIFCARGGSTIYQIPELVQFVTNYYQHILIRRVGRGGSI